MEYVAINDQFGQSGKPQELMDLYGLNTKGIVEAAKRSIARKK
jgi:transketolase